MTNNRYSFYVIFLNVEFRNETAACIVLRHRFTVYKILRNPLTTNDTGSDAVYRLTKNCKGRR